MIKLRCQCCASTNSSAVYSSQRFPELLYCGDCLRHAQRVLHGLLGDEFITSVVLSSTNHLLKEFGHESSPNQIFFYSSPNAYMTGPGNDSEYTQRSKA